MLIVGKYSFNGGEKFIKMKFPHLLDEIESTITGINAERSKTRESRELFLRSRTRMLYNPQILDKEFKNAFQKIDWYPKREFSNYSTTYYIEEYKKIIDHTRREPRPFREIDFVKDRLAVELQFGKYAFMLYDICVKMVIFKNLGYIDAGIEIVPIKQFANEMATGVSYFEQIIWDLEKRGVSDIDIPVLIIGVTAESLLGNKETGL